jgi:hypothetical protein
MTPHVFEHVFPASSSGSQYILYGKPKEYKESSSISTCCAPWPARFESDGVQYGYAFTSDGINRFKNLFEFDMRTNVRNDDPKYPIIQICTNK